MGRRLQVCAESQQTAIAILHHELPLVPWHVAKSPSEFHALGGVLGIKCVGTFNGEKLEIRNQKLEIRNWKLETRNRRQEIRN